MYYIKMKIIILYFSFFVFVIHSLICVQCKRHVCGGRSELQVIEELFVQNSHTLTEEQLTNVFRTTHRKAAWVQKHTNKLMKKYEALKSNPVQQRQLNSQAHQQLIMSASDCLNHMDTGILENSIWTNIGDMLREQYTILLEIISVLTTMEYEEIQSESNLFSENLRSIRSASEQLLCEIYVGIGISGGPIPDREIPGSVPLCMFRERIERYERDYILLYRINLIAQMFQDQYIS